MRDRVRAIGGQDFYFAEPSGLISGMTFTDIWFDDLLSEESQSEKRENSQKNYLSMMPKFNRRKK